MFPLKLNKNKQLIIQLEKLFKISEDVLCELRGAVIYVIENQIDNHFEVLVEKINEMERNADEIIKFTKHKIISQSLLPETREDLLEILDAMDNIPDNCESASIMILDQQLIPVDQIKDDLLELLNIGIECYSHTVAIARDFLLKMRNVYTCEQKINDLERIGDKLERKIIRTIFSSKKLSAGERLLQKNLVREIGELCDISQHISKRIVVASIKREI